MLICHGNNANKMCSGCSTKNGLFKLSNLVHFIMATYSRFDLVMLFFIRHSPVAQYLLITQKAENMKFVNITTAWICAAFLSTICRLSLGANYQGKAVQIKRHSRSVISQNHDVSSLNCDRGTQRQFLGKYLFGRRQI